MHDEPLAFFITWTVYGTHLQGDSDGWRRRGNGSQLPRPHLEEWRRDRLTYDVLLLGTNQRLVVESACQKHCEHRQWKCWAVNARSNHVHVIVSGSGYSGRTVRDQLKANCTRELRESWDQFLDRPVWTTGGDWVCVNSEDDLSAVFEYVRDGQDRKDRGLAPSG